MSAQVGRAGLGAFGFERFLPAFFMASIYHEECISDCDKSDLGLLIFFKFPPQGVGPDAENFGRFHFLALAVIQHA